MSTRPLPRPVGYCASCGRPVSVNDRIVLEDGSCYCIRCLPPADPGFWARFLNFLVDPLAGWYARSPFGRRFYP
jgi:hypothetical protein